jgi:hypothetical protein
MKMASLGDVVQTIEQVRTRYRAASVKAEALMKHLQKLYLLECKMRFGFEPGVIVESGKKIYRVAEIYSYNGGITCFYLGCNERLKSGGYSRRITHLPFVPPERKPNVRRRK